MEPLQPQAADTVLANLMLAGQQQHQAGRLDEAAALYRRVLAQAPEHAGALGLLGLLHQQQGALEDALDCLRRAAQAEPAQAVFRLTLAHLLAEMGRPVEAEAACRQSLERDPGSFDAWLHLGRLCQNQGRHTEAVAALRHAAALRPGAVEAWHALGLAQMALEDWDGAHASFIQALEARPGDLGALCQFGVVLRHRGALAEAWRCFDRVLAREPRHALALFHLGTLHFNQRDWAPAIRCYEAALEAEPDLVEARQNLASIYLDAGQPEQARQHRDAAYRRRPVFTEPARRAPRRTVLVLWAAGKGNVPIDHLLPRAHTTRLICFIEYLGPEHERALPPYDYVFNAIGDVDVTGPTDGPARAFLARCGRPVLNRPEAVARTGRDAAAALLGGIDGVVVPRTAGFDTAVLQRELPATAGLDFPVIVRPANSHGGDHLVKLGDGAALRALVPFNAERYYATAYVDYRSADGFFRKYRMVFVDRQPWPYHLAIGPHWMVHYASADMEAHAWKLEEEARFLADPATALGPRAWAALQAIGHALDLDYAGIDFSLLPDGRLLLFEANATMLVHPEAADGPLAHKNRHVARIYAAFDALVDRVVAATKEKGA